MKIIPTGNRIAVVPKEQYLGTMKAKSDFWEVTATGEDVGREHGFLGFLGFKKKNRIKAGDVIVAKFGVDPTEFEGETFYIAQEDNEFILGKVV
jgi:hypothetical protein